MICRYKAYRCTFSTGYHALPSEWNKSKCRLKAKKGTINSQVNAMLDRMELEAKRSFSKYLNDTYDAGGVPAWDEWKIDVFRPAMARLTMRQLPEQRKAGFFELIEQVISERSNSPEFAASTIRVYKQMRDHLRGFEKQWGRKVTFHSIDLDFSLDFRQYMYDRGYEQNTVHGMLKYVRSFMQIGLEQGLHDNTAYKSRRFQVKQRPAMAVYVSIDELEELYQRSYPAHLRNTVDRFVAMAYTGLRFSDAEALRQNHIEGNNIRIRQSKTGGLVVIPLHPIVEEVMDKNDGRLPKVVNQVFNRQIKEAAKIANCLFVLCVCSD